MSVFLGAVHRWVVMILLNIFQDERNENISFKKIYKDDYNFAHFTCKYDIILPK